MKAVQAAFGKLSDGDRQKMLNKESVILRVEENDIVIEPEDVTIENIVQEGLVAQNSGDIVVALDTELDDELCQMGLAREIINKVNLQRKEEGFDIADRIEVVIDSTDQVKEVIEKYRETIQDEILAVSFHFTTCEAKEVDLNGQNAKIALKKARACIT